RICSVQTDQAPEGYPFAALGRTLSAVREGTMRTIAARLAVVCVFLGVAGPALAADEAAVTRALKADLESYLKDRGAIEHISAASLSVSIAGAPEIDVAVGTTTFGGTEPAAPANLVQ